jgi:DNA-binding NtrC family response regulator
MAATQAQTKGKILLVDDDPGLLRLLSIRLRAEGYDVEAAESAHKALAAMNRFTPDLVITDLRMDKMDGIELLRELQTRSPGLRVVIITAHGTIPDAVVATQSGAFGFLTKPVDKDELMITVETALRVSGSVDVVMAENLLESELFGHEKGAFTGAIRKHKGLFQSAEGGTLLLDEIGDMPMPLQVKLLRVLQEHQVRPVGGTEALQIDVRVISATHRDLQALMQQGRFREDLYYRLNVVNIRIPTLDERREDIPLLVSHFLQSIGKEDGQERKVYAPEAVEMLVTAEWPGNVRQLYNIVRHNVALSRSPVISGDLVQQSLGEHAGKFASFTDARDEFTRNYLSQILQITMGNVSQAARLAKRNRTDFYKLLARHELNPDQFKIR